MAEDELRQAGDTLSVKDLRNYLDYETTCLTKATELRLRELGGIVTAYAAGELTPQKAMERFDQYQKRWGEALPGVWRVHGVTDEEIVAKIDGTPTKHTTAEQRKRRTIPTDRPHGI